MATGHQLGDTGNYSNTFYVGRPTESAGGSVTPTVNSSRVRRELDQFFGGDYLSEETVLKAARVRGFSTAVIGKGEAASIFDHTEQSGEQTILFDDATGSPAGISLSEEVKAALRAAGLPLTPPSQGENAKIGDFKTPGTTVANVEQQAYFVDVATKVVLPIFKARNKPFVLVYWSRDPEPAAKASYPDVVSGFLPRGFLAIDIAKALDLPLFDPDNHNARVGENATTRSGNGVIGNDAEKPEAIIAANGGSDLIYIPSKNRQLISAILKALYEQDYVSGVFVDDTLGSYAGALPLSAINLRGRAVTPRPSIVVNFRSFTTGCDEPTLCAAIVADTRYQQGQGIHGSLSRADTMNFMAAIGPDFRRGFVDTAPVSNADIGMTMAHLLGLQILRKGNLVGRVIREAMPGGRMPQVSVHTRRSPARTNGPQTVLIYQQVGSTRYLDAAGFPGRTVGVPDGNAVSQR